jgi:maltooligosyltrehalose synthase
MGSAAGRDRRGWCGGTGPWLIVEDPRGRRDAAGSWLIDGTTGYDFLETMVAVRGSGERRLTEAFQVYTGEAFDPANESRRAWLEVMTDALALRARAATDLGMRACGTSAACRITCEEVKRRSPAARRVFDYRTYWRGVRATEDRQRIATAATAAAAARPDVDRDSLAFLEAALAFELPSPEARAQVSRSL